MTTHEIRPKQLRALLLLLVLVPFIPTVLMVRFVVDAVQSEREAAIERTRAIHQQTLFKADASFEKQVALRGKVPTPTEAYAHYRQLFDSTVQVLVIDPAGQRLAGEPRSHGVLMAQSSLRAAGVPWTIEVWLHDQSALNATIKEQVKIYAWTVVVAVVAIFSIAVIAAVTVSRQLALHELKSTSVATVAHELRTPLASMRLLVDTLREGRYRGETQLREYLDLIARENARLIRLTDNFVTLSRLEHKQQAFARESISPRELAEEAVQAMRPKLDSPSVHFTLHAAQPLPEMLGDREAMLAVLTNLLENALKYTENDKEISLALRHDRGNIIFSVVDNGIGLSRADRRHIFEPFYQSDQKLSRAREGCGLGLSIVKHIVAAHGGQVTVTSEPGKGSAFHVMIPAASNRMS
jgi:signal transduction histidine kinase